MRAMLVFNPFATSTTDVTKNRIVERLSSALDLTVHPTTGRDDATSISAQAAADGFELLIGYGGDGTLNELANGLLHNGANPEGPALAAIPGGNANVFARNLQFSSDPIEATEQLLDSIARNSTKTIGVGQLVTESHARYFLFNSGIGVDAAVLAKMDARRQSGKRVTDTMYTAIAIQELLSTTAQRDVAITLRTSDGSTFDELKFALVINLAPWIYIGERPITLTPDATLDKALSVYAPADLSMPGLLNLGRTIFGKKIPQHNNRQITLSDQDQVSFHSDKPLWVQVDGEALSQETDVTMKHISQALRVYI
jgi:diacylglycerol kinase family enzyme